MVSATTPTLSAARRRGRELSDRALGLLMLAPMTLLLLLLVGYPLVSSLILSLYRVNLANPEQGQPFVGLGNYLYAFRQPDFWYSVQRTFYFTLISVGLELALGLVFALLLNERFRGQLPARLAMIAPWALLTVSNGVLWAWILNPTYGIANTLLVRAGLIAAPKPWLSDTFWTMNVIILADVWKTTPFVALMLLAGLQNIDASLYEAARIDGASAWRQFRYVTLPLLNPAILVALIFRTLDAFRVFDLIYVLTGGGPGTSTEPLALYTFNALLQNLRFGYGSALSVIVFGITFVLALLYIRLLGADLVGGKR